MKEPILVVMAAGMGSRYGGLKQIDSINRHGNIIIDYSVFDALRAGFKRIVFIIKRSIEADFKEIIGNRIGKLAEVRYVYQELGTLPDGFAVPPERVKPWGTGHAVLLCADVIDAPFAVINADDFYGKSSFELMYNGLKTLRDNQKYRYMMIGYSLGNTLTEHGHVSRGVCKVDTFGRLLDIKERTHIEKVPTGAAFLEDEKWTFLPQDSIASMNLWGFTPSIIPELGARFRTFLSDNLTKNPLKCEYFLPSAVGELIAENRAEVRVLSSDERWYGVTYREDKPVVSEAIAKLTEAGVYPESLWEGK